MFKNHNVNKLTVHTHKVHVPPQPRGTSQYTGGQGCHPEGPGRQGGAGQQGAHEIHQGQMQNHVLEMD